MKPKFLWVCLAVFLFPKSGSGQSTLQSRTYRFEDLTSQKGPTPPFARFSTVYLIVEFTFMFMKSFCCREARRITPIITNRKKCF